MVRTATLVLAVALCVVSIIPGVGSAQPVGVIKDVVDSASSNGKVDWTTGVITAVGIGSPPSQPANPGQARAIAERAAQGVAYRNMLEAVKVVQVDSTTTAGNFIVSSDIIKNQVDGIIQGAMIMDKKYMPDGSVEVTVGMRLTGALADALLPKAAPSAARAVPQSSAATGRIFTGLIVDARGLGARPAMAPKILNGDGKEVYGSAYINRGWAVREGMAGYMKDATAARANPRVADKPFTVKAIRVSGDARVDLVISNSDAATLQGASQNLSMLEKCRVIILVD